MSWALGFVPFIDPLPIWSTEWLWSLLLLPLCAGVALVYKCVKCERPEKIFRESVVLFITIIVGMILAAVALSGVVWLME